VKRLIIDPADFHCGESQDENVRPISGVIVDMAAKRVVHRNSLFV
jgi:hypothetical protein